MASDSPKRQAMIVEARKWLNRNVQLTVQRPIDLWLADFALEMLGDSEPATTTEPQYEHVRRRPL